MPRMDSVPMPWAAAARLRVACFLSSFFEVMAAEMEPGKFDKLEHWRNNFLHSENGISANKNRTQFWFEVVKNALAKLRENDFQRLKEWMLYGQDEKIPILSNGEINTELKNILRPSMEKFFNSPVVKESLRHCTVEFGGRKWDLPFVFIVDEAAYLYQTNYMHSFMWVLDQPIVQLLYQEISNPAAKRFFVLMLGTHSQISHFAPHYNFPSERYFTGRQHIPTVFSALDWDSGVRAPPNNSGFESSAEIGRLVCWGRPIWLSYYNGRSELSDHDRLRVCVTFAMDKLTEGWTPRTNENDEHPSKLSAFAVLALRIHLDLDFVHPSRASRLVSSKMRWLVDVDSHRKHITTTYGSEPLLVEAAACLMNSYRLGLLPGSNPIAHFLHELGNDLNKGHVNRGRNGELTARLLLIMAKDQATRQVWWGDKSFLSRIRFDTETRSYSRKDFQRGGELYFEESDIFYGKPSSSSAFYHRAVKVKGTSPYYEGNGAEFLKVLLRPEVYNQLRTHFEKNKKWKSLDRAYVNFTHFAPVKERPGAFAFTKHGFFAGWQRHVAFYLQNNFPTCDLIIPMAFRYRRARSDIINPDCMSYIIISVKNRSGNEMIKEPFLTRECVEGVCVQGEVKPVSDDVTIRLTLHQLKFINPGGIPSSGDISDDAWIQSTKEKPFIAFAMSMGDTARETKLFVGEKHANYNSHRIAFALRGLINTYNMYDDVIKKTITEINVRHDASGRYPQTSLDYRLERDIANESRKPLDSLLHFTSYWDLDDKKDVNP